MYQEPETVSADITQKYADDTEEESLKEEEAVEATNQTERKNQNSSMIKQKL